MTLGLGGPALVRIPTNDRFELRRRTRSTRRSPRTAPPAGTRSRSSRRSARPRRRPSTRSPPSPTSPRARALAPRRRRVRRRRRDRSRTAGRRSRAGSAPTRSSSTRTSGCSRRSTRRSCSAAGWTCSAPRSASCRSTSARSTASDPVRDYNEYQPQLGRRMRALKLWIQLRWFGLDGLRRRIAPPPRAGAARSPAGSTPTRTGSGSRRSRSRRSASATRRRGAGAATRTRLDARTTPRSWTRSTAPARCSCRTRGSRPVHDPPRDRQPAHGGRATSSGRGSCCREAARLRRDQGRRR